MWETTNSQRKAQRFAALAAVTILAALIVMWPIGGSAADWLNESWAPTAEADRYELVSAQDDVTFDMDADAFRSSGTYKSYYVWQNSSGDIHYSNVSHTTGTFNTIETATSGVDITGNISYNVLPYFKVYWDYTAHDAYKDNVVRIQLNITGLASGASSAKSRTIELSAGGVTFYSKTLSASDTSTSNDATIEISTNDLRRAIINDKETGYFTLIVKGTDGTLSIDGSDMYTYSSSNMINRDDPLLIIGALTIGATFLGIIAVQPKNSISFGKKTPKGGQF